MEKDLTRLSQTLQRIPSFRGKQRLCKWFLKQHFQASGPVRIQDGSGNQFSVPSLQEPIASGLFVDGVYEKRLKQFLEASLKPTHTFLDIGANVGVYSVLASKQLVQGRVLSVEASPAIFPYLERNLELNACQNVQANHVAIADKAGTMPFYMPPDEKFGMGSFAPQFYAKPQEVETVTLDQLLQQQGIDSVDVMKVDVEGYEALVFSGAQKLLQQTPSPLIVFEFLEWAESRANDITVGQAQRLLQEHGFSLWRMEDYLQDKPPLSAAVVEGGCDIVAKKL